MADPAESAAEDAWQAAVGKVLKGAALDTITSHTADGIAIAPLYPAGDGAGVGPWRASAEVGIHQRVDHSDPGAAHALARLDLDNGATGLVLVGAGSATAHGFGLAPGDLGAVLDGLPLWTRFVRLEFAPDHRMAAIEALLAQADRDGYAPQVLRLDLGLDPLDPPADVCAAAGKLRDRGVAGYVLRADGRPHHAAGASEAQELAAVLSAGVAALRALEPLGLPDARDSLSFALAADANQMLTIAKLRALRRLWARVETACGLTPRPVRLHAETAWRMMARRDPYTNVLRSTVAAVAAILGGADSLTVLPFTSALGLPDAFARRLARNTALVLLEESYLGRVADPAAGSGAFEALTDALATEAWRLFQSVERQGGLASAIASGEWPRAVAALQDKRQAALAQGDTTLVGVTRFRNPAEGPPPVLMPMPDVPDEPPNPLPPVREAAAFEDGGG